MSQTTTILDLPRDVFHLIFQLLPLKDVVRCSAVCKVFNARSSDNTVWHFLAKIQWKIPPQTSGDNFIWKDYFIKRYRRWDPSNKTPEVRVFRKKFKGWSGIGNFCATEQILSFTLENQLIILDLVTGQTLSTINFIANDSNKETFVLSHPQTPTNEKSSTLCVALDRFRLALPQSYSYSGYSTPASSNIKSALKDSTLSLWSYTKQDLAFLETPFVADRWFHRRNIVIGLIGDHLLLLVWINADLKTEHSYLKIMTEEFTNSEISEASANKDNIFFGLKSGAFFMLSNPGPYKGKYRDNTVEIHIRAKVPFTKTRNAPVIAIEDGSEYVAYMHQGQNIHVVDQKHALDFAWEVSGAGCVGEFWIDDRDLIVRTTRTENSTRTGGLPHQISVLSYNLKSKKCTTVWASNSDRVDCSELSESVVALGLTDGSVHITDLDSRKHFRTIWGHNLQITKIVIFESCIASIALDNTLAVWNYEVSHDHSATNPKLENLISNLPKDSSAIESWIFQVGSLLLTPEDIKMFVDLFLNLMCSCLSTQNRKQLDVLKQICLNLQSHSLPEYYRANNVKCDEIREMQKETPGISFRKNFCNSLLDEFKKSKKDPIRCAQYKEILTLLYQARYISSTFLMSCLNAFFETSDWRSIDEIVRDNVTYLMNDCGGEFLAFAHRCQDKGKLSWVSDGTDSYDSFGRDRTKSCNVM